MAKARSRPSRDARGERWTASQKVTPTPTGKAPGALWYRPRHTKIPGKKPRFKFPWARAKKKKKPTGPKKSVWRRYWWAFVGAPLFLILAFFGTLVYAYAHLEIPAPHYQKQTSYLYDRNGKLITTLHLGVDRTPVPFSDMPKVLRQAVIATEDAGYYNHGGISPMAILRAAWADLTNREFVQGGSTITQQYVKQVYTGSERSLFRKIKEAMLAIKLEHKYSKNQILEKYLNTIYFGHGAYGVEAAAKTYFGIHARDLGMLQSATLAGTIAAPSRFDPIDHPSDGFVRRNYVLDRMADEGFITQTRADHLKRRKIDTIPQRPQHTKAPYFMDYAVKWLKDRFGKRAVYSGGLRVTTTVDLGWQLAAQEAIHSHLPAKGDPSAALVAIDPETGAVRALAGKRKDFLLGDFNPAIDGAGRQTGSAFKMFTLTTAFAQRISPFSYWNGPSEVTIDDSRCDTNGEHWSPSNYADEGEGTMNLLSATANSVNTIFAQLVVALKDGPEDVVTMAHKLGIRSPLQAVCSITLGTQDVHPLDMANSYATIADRGLRHNARPIEKVTKPDGTVLARPHGPGFRAVQPNIADMVTYALQGVIDHGTGTAAAIGRPAAGKTGTGENYTNAWFCGYVPQLAACVWVGYPEGSIPLENVEGVPAVFGGSIPAEIWHDFMTTATAGMPLEDFQEPTFSDFTGHPDISVAPPPPPAPSPQPSASPEPSPSATPSPKPSPPPPTPSPSPPPSPTPTPTISPPAKPP